MPNATCIGGAAGASAHRKPTDATPPRRMCPVQNLPDAPAKAPHYRRQRAGVLAKPLRTGRSLRRYAGRQLRLRLSARPAALPLALLLLALATLFLLGHDRAHFYRGDWHGWNSSQTLAFAENLSFADNLLVFRYQARDADGNPIYPGLYSRFPLGGYVLVKLAILPFGDTDFRAKIYAGRMLMLLLFSAAAVLAYGALARITGSRWDALAATLLAFSSYYVLYYADKISNEVTTELFAAMLAVHGMSVFVCEGRFRQLVIKSCLALLLGWHVYAFLLPFIVFGLAIDVLKAHRSAAVVRGIGGRTKSYGAAILHSRYPALGAITLLFGIAVLTFNFGNEYFGLNGTVPLRELPSVKSALGRLSLDAESRDTAFDWVGRRGFVPDQIYRIAVMTLPYAVNPYPIKGRIPAYQFRDYPALAFGVITLGFCLAGLALAWAEVRRRLESAGRRGRFLLLATLIFAGFCWAVPLRRNVTTHDFETVFYIGIPLAAFIMALLLLRRYSRSRLSPYFAVAALTVFVVSVSAMASVGKSRAELASDAAQLDEYTAIRELVDDSASVYATWEVGYFHSGGAPWAGAYFMAGKTLIRIDKTFISTAGDTIRKAPDDDDDITRKAPADGDYLLLLTRVDSPALLTPQHRYAFLYDWSLYDQWRRTAHPGAPIVDADWRVYLNAGHLTYMSRECAYRDEQFYLHLVPRYVGDLPARRRAYGFDNRDFAFRWEGVVLTDGSCVVERPLPDYDIVAIRTGQYNADGPLWGGEYAPPAP